VGGHSQFLGAFGKSFEGVSTCVIWRLRHRCSVVRAGDVSRPHVYNGGLARSCSPVPCSLRHYWLGDASDSSFSIVFPLSVFLVLRLSCLPLCAPSLGEDLSAPDRSCCQLACGLGSRPGLTMATPTPMSDPRWVDLASLLIFTSLLVSVPSRPRVVPCSHLAIPVLLRS